MQPFNPLDLIKAVNHDVSKSSSHRCAKFILRLVIAVHHTATCWNTCVQSDKQFTTGCNIKQQAFFIHQLHNGCVDECLRCIDHSISTERRYCLSTCFAQMLLVIDECGRAELSRNLCDRYPTDRQGAISIHRCRSRQETHLDGAHICSGARMPNNDNPCSMTRAVASHNARRDSRVSSWPVLSTGQCS